MAFPLPFLIIGGLVVLGGAFLFLRPSSLNLGAPTPTPTPPQPPVVQGAPEQAISAVTPFSPAGIVGGLFRQQQPVFSTPMSPSDGGFIRGAPPSSDMTRHHPPTPTPTPIPTPIHHGGSKFFQGVIIPYINIPSQLAAYTSLGPGDMILAHKVSNLASIKIPNVSIYGYEDVSLAALQNGVGKGFNFLSYDLETGAGFAPVSETSNPLAAVQQASTIAHSKGMQLCATPTKGLWRAEMGRSSDLFNGQGEAMLSTNVAGYVSYIKQFSAGIKAVNPNCRVIAELNMDRQTLAGSQSITQQIIGSVDGVTSWFSAASVPTLAAYVKWFKQTF